MFGIFKKDPLKKLEEAYRLKMEEALAAQRKGDIERFSELSSEADLIDKEMNALSDSTK
ncbi:MAG: hypothetical protein ACJAT2_002154 [Bacteriovoracaceae bacterium]|jgi:hypothetical protein